MALTIYGSPSSRTMRVLWMATELNLEFTHVPLEHDDPALKAPEFLRLNAAGAIPTIVDGDYALAESLAINLYLAKKYGAGLAEPVYPATANEEADVWRWSLWAQGHLEPWVQNDRILTDLIDAIGDRAGAMVGQSLETLERALFDRAWLVGERFSVGDLNVAAVLSPSRSGKLDLTPYGRVADWLARCYARPAAVATRRRFQG